MSYPGYRWTVNGYVADPCRQEYEDYVGCLNRVPPGCSTRHCNVLRDAYDSCMWTCRNPSAPTAPLEDPCDLTAPTAPLDDDPFCDLKRKLRDCYKEAESDYWEAIRDCDERFPQPKPDCPKPDKPPDCPEPDKPPDCPKPEPECPKPEPEPGCPDHGDHGSGSSDDDDDGGGGGGGGGGHHHHGNSSDGDSSDDDDDSTYIYTSPSDSDSESCGGAGVPSAADCSRAGRQLESCKRRNRPSVFCSNAGRVLNSCKRRHL